MRRTMFKAWVALNLWLKHGIEWTPDSYTKFGIRTAWYMADEIWSFRQFLRERGLVIERF